MEVSVVRARLYHYYYYYYYYHHHHHHDKYEGHKGAFMSYSCHIVLPPSLLPPP